MCHTRWIHCRVTAIRMREGREALSDSEIKRTDERIDIGIDFSRDGRSSIVKNKKKINRHENEHNHMALVLMSLSDEFVFRYVNAPPYPVVSLVCWSVGLLVTQTFDDPLGASTWPCFLFMAEYLTF